MRPSPRLLLALAALLGAAACATNYTDPAGPRYSGPLPAPPTGATGTAGGADTLLVVSFNVEFGERPDSALAVLRETPEIRDADVVLLQEMDAPGTEALARELEMAWVYYPAVERHTGRDFGNAVLSRWPIVEDEKLVLPYRGAFNQSQRTATAATLQVGRTRVRVYSVHLATPVSMAWRYRKEQWERVLEDADGWPHVVVGGDLNSGSLGELALRRGFAWPTREGPRTLLWGRWDHLLVRGLGVPAEGAAGTVEDNRGASDHLPVWARAVLPGG